MAEISKELETIDSLLMEFHERIRSGRCLANRRQSSMMLSHWYGVWDYSHYPQAVVVSTADNGHCIVWLYFLSYIYMPLAMLPVSYFFHYCWLFRVPFVYFIGINAIRAYYRHWLITPDMIEGHHILIVFILFLYAYGFVKIACERSKVCA